MTTILTSSFCEAEAAHVASIDAASPCLHALFDPKQKARQNLVLNGTYFAHIITLRLVHAPPV